MKTYRGFPERLHHEVPHWADYGALFHIRIAPKTMLRPSSCAAHYERLRRYETANGASRAGIRGRRVPPSHRSATSIELRPRALKT
jgi:hypothetical protein